MTSLQLSEWVGAHVPVFRQMQIKDHAKYLGVVIGPGAAAHRWTKSRNTFIAVCARLHASAQNLVQRPVSFKVYALSVLSFVGSVAAQWKIWHSKGFRQAHFMRSHLPCIRRRSACGLKIDVDGIQLTSKAARFRVASRSAQLSTGMARIRAAKDHCGRTLDSFARSWDDRSFRTSTAYCTLPLPCSWSVGWTASEARETCRSTRCNQGQLPCYGKVETSSTLPAIAQTVPWGLLTSIVCTCS